MSWGNPTWAQDQIEYFLVCYVRSEKSLHLEGRRVHTHTQHLDGHFCVHWSTSDDGELVGGLEIFNLRQAITLLLEKGESYGC
jgi:hypothetical protein